MTEKSSEATGVEVELPQIEEEDEKIDPFLTTTTCVFLVFTSFCNFFVISFINLNRQYFQ